MNDKKSAEIEIYNTLYIPQFDPHESTHTKLQESRHIPTLTCLHRSLDCQHFKKRPIVCVRHTFNPQFGIFCRYLRIKDRLN